MPDKDGSEDKKSTKSVVNKKQKQFMNQEEQLDLSSVAESFGGQIIGEPVELDEFVVSGTLGTAALIAKYGLPLAMTALGAYGTSRQLQGKPLSIKIPNLGIKDKAKKVFGKIKKVINPNAEKKANINNPKEIEKKYNRRNNNNQQDIGGPTGGTRGRANNTIDLTKELEKRRRILDQQTSKKNVNKDVFNKTKEKFFGKNKNGSGNKSNKKGVGFGLGLGSGLGTSTLISTLTKTKQKKGSGGFRLGGLPGTAHNVGRRTNPQ